MLTNIAVTYHHLNEKDKASEAEDRALKIMNDNYRPDHPLTLQIRQNMLVV